LFAVFFVDARLPGHDHQARVGHFERFEEELALGEAGVSLANVRVHPNDVLKTLLHLFDESRQNQAVVAHVSLEWAYFF